MREPDVVIVGGGHNGLVAAAYLARAGRRGQVLERVEHVGGAPGAAPPLVRVRLPRRRCASYTPDPAAKGRTGLLIGPQSTFGAVGAADDEAPFDEFYR